jgi:hypothetical protein
MNRRLCFGVLAIALFCVRSAMAIDAYNNFGPSDTYDASTGYSIDGGDFAPFTPRISGSRFTSEATGQLAVIRIALHNVFHAPPGVNLVDIRLHSANPAGELGPVIAAFTRSGLPDFGGLDAPETIVNSDPAVTLTTGERYWIVVAPGDSTTRAVWNWNTTGAADRFTTSTNFGLTYGYSESRVGAMRIELISIPEPATFTALAVGIVALTLGRRHKR